MFEHATKLGVCPCEQGDETWGARNNFRNGEGWQALELLECLVLQEDVDKVTAKLYSPLEGCSASVVSLLEEGIECIPWWDKEPLAARKWPS